MKISETFVCVGVCAYVFKMCVCVCGCLIDNVCDISNVYDEQQWVRVWGNPPKLNKKKCFAVLTFLFAVYGFFFLFCCSCFFLSAIFFFYLTHVVCCNLTLKKCFFCWFDEMCCGLRRPVLIAHMLCILIKDISKQ